MDAFFVWELVDAPLLLDRQWGSDTLVWNRVAGDTHLLNDLATRIYRRLAQAPASPQDLLSDLNPRPSEPVDTPSAVEAALQEMARLGLVVARPL